MLLSVSCDVLKYFNKINEANVQCKLCDVTLAYRRATSSMINHLMINWIKHKEKTAEMDTGKR